MIAQAISRIVNATLNNPAMSLNDPRTWDELLAGSVSEAGIAVTHKGSLGIAAVWQCVLIISGDVAMLPLNRYKRLPSGNREIERRHRTQRLVTRQPNKDMSAFELWRRAMVHALIWGNGYIFIERQSRVGPPISMINLLPDRTAPFFDDTGDLFYKTEAGGTTHVLAANEVFHIKGLSIDNSIGMDFVNAARDAWGLALAAQGFASKFFANGAQGGGFLEIPASMTVKSKNRLAEGFDAKHTGKDNWFKTVILRDGAKFHQTTIDAQKSQLTEVREESVREAGRYHNVPPFKLGLTDSQSYNSQEQAQLAYLAGCLNHWLHGIAGEAFVKLLSETEQRTDGYFFEHNTSKLIETDVKTQTQTLISLRNAKIVTANEVRRKLNLKDRDDPDGDAFENPVIKESAGATEGGDESGSAQAVANAHRDLLADVFGRMARRVGFEARQAAKKPDRFAAWLQSHTTDSHALFAEAVEPALNLIAASTGADADDLMLEVKLQFFAEFIALLQPLLKAPYKWASLAANVDAACAKFEIEIAATLIPLIMENTDGT